MSENQKTTSVGTGLGTLVFVVFLTLKLAGIGQVATWSWWWVTSPLWIPFAIIMAIFLVIGFIGLASTILEIFRK